MKVEKILEAIEALAPPSLCAHWDNSGLLVGDRQQQVSCALVALDVTKETIAEAVDKGCQLMISHHPLIFQPMKQVVEGDFQGELLRLLIKNDISLISAHTNLDNAPLGVNYALAEVLGLEHVEMLCQDNDNPSYMGYLPKALNGSALIEKVKQALGLAHVCAAGLEEEKPYRSIAVCGGAGVDLWQQTKAAGADCLLTAEGKHHIGIAAKHFGMTIVDAGHFSTEQVVLPRLTAYLTQHCPGVQFIRSQRESNPWNIY